MAPREYPPGPRPAAVYDVLMRRRVAETLSLEDTWARVHDARAADNRSELRRALVDLAACTIRLLEDLEPDTTTP